MKLLSLVLKRKATKHIYMKTFLQNHALLLFVDDCYVVGVISASPEYLNVKAGTQGGNIGR